MREVMEQVEVAEQVGVEDLVGGVEDLVPRWKRRDSWRRRKQGKEKEYARGVESREREVSDGLDTSNALD
ncbi:hypothetical protein Tco_1217382 [Tanacetum coccineum]